ncbi:helix-turn-helix transcriptional regulator [Parasphingorhabdus cellanae]|uniref:Helix-turn-helix transcriptional regulator n=1 Tax=Parasphingorhabdus cellanae TaxID=2806553 RepID=A0ABX7T0X8_9SPHN|nr:helix-turn-helix transcriptional regulator [Parasphingorhabdus cellanae]QTD54618.1 helix-turn-helix transcriptional regulator [Parasphingorhabdus cellanae]
MPRQSIKTDKDGNLKKLGDAIRAARKARGFSQEAFADAAGIDRSHMGKIERGERNLSVLNIIRIASALDDRASDVFRAAGL